MGGENEQGVFNHMDYNGDFINIDDRLGSLSSSALCIEVLVRGNTGGRDESNGFTRN